jgi:GMP reductase
MKVFDYEDVQLIPRKGIVKSRSECKTSVRFGKHEFKLPIVPANMKSVIDEKLVIKLAEKGYFYIMHRFNVDSLEFTKKMHAKNLIASISIGVKPKDHEVINKFAAEKVYPDYITIDIAHGHSIVMKEMLEHIKSKFGDKTFIIAGNVGTPNGVADLEE